MLPMTSLNPMMINGIPFATGFGMDVELETSTHQVAAAERGPLTSTHILYNMIRDAKRRGDKKLVKRLIAAYDEAAVREAVTVSATTSVEGGRVKLVLCPAGRRRAGAVRQLVAPVGI